MVRRQIAAWFVSSSSVVVAGGVAVSAVSVPAGPTGAAGPAPTVTVYEDRYVDEIRIVSPAADPTGSGPLGNLTPEELAAIATAAWPATFGRSTPGSAPAVTAPGSGSGAGSAVPVVSWPQSSPTASVPSSSAPRPAPAPSTAAPTTPPATSPRTTAPRTTVPQTTSPTTTWPRGTELPDDWPAGVPYPPIPPNCHKPHLEDNGVWNCEH